MRRCPTCEEEIDEHLEICPWCGRRTGFEPKKRAPQSLIKRIIENAKANRLLLVVGFGMAMIGLAVGLVVGCLSNRADVGMSSRLGVSEVIDSFTNVMPPESKVVARFNDDRHCIYYLNSGHLMKFNAASKMLDEVNPNNMIDEPHVYYNDRDTLSGITEAELSADEKFIIIRAISERNEKEPEKNKMVSFQLNTESMNLMPYKYVPPKKNYDANADSLRKAWAARQRYLQRNQEQHAETQEPAAPAPQPVETPLEEQPVATPTPAPAPAPATAPATSGE